MSKIVELDGVRHEFPDDATDADVSAALAGPASASDNAAPTEALRPPSMTESFGRGMLRPLVGGYQALAHMLPPGQGVTDPDAGLAALNQPPTPDAATIDKLISDTDSDYAARRKAAGETGTDWPQFAGQVATTLPLAAVGNIGVIPGVIAGAASSMLEPVGDPSKGFGEQKLRQGLFGAGTSAWFNLLGKGFKAAAAGVTDPLKRSLLDAGVTLTPGQLLGKSAAALEEKLSSVPILGGMIKSAQHDAIKDFNRGIYNQALEPIGEKAEKEAGHLGVAEVRDKLSKSYNDVLSKMTFAQDAQFGQDMGHIAQDSLQMTPDKQAQFNWIMQNKVLPRMASGQMDGNAVKALESELGSSIDTFGGGGPDDQILAKSIAKVREAVLSNLERTNPPELAERLAATNKGWAIYAQIRDAASRLGQKERGIFSPAQYLSAVRAGDSSVGKGAFAENKALTQPYAEAGTSILGQHVPDSGTAGRIGAMLALGGGAKMLGLGPVGIASALAGMIPYTRLGQRGLNLLAHPGAWKENVGKALPLLSAPVAASATNAGLLGSGGQSLLGP